ncbi:MAG: C1 family peptidase, partial [Archaeoglobaceae archaeon]
MRKLVYCCLMVFILNSVLSLPVAGMPNPAAIRCVNLGYKYVIKATPSGELGFCVFPDGSECESWALYDCECGLSWNGKNCSEKLKAGKIANLVKKEEITSTVDPSIYFDWRNFKGKDYTTPVKDQGLCGACWAFAIVAVLESLIEIKRDAPDLNPDLSEQDLISCSSAGDCSGGSSYMALSYLKSHGIVKESCFPYSDYYCSPPACFTTKKCSEKCSIGNEIYKISNFWNLTDDIGTIKRFLVSYGPLVAVMRYDSKGYFDENGIFRCIDDSFLEEENHAVVLVGYNETGKYWIVRNSWGATWNGDGHFKVGYGECSIEKSVYLVDFVPQKIYVPDNYRKVQDAINNAKSGDWIIVRDGIYNESINVNRSVLLIAESTSGAILDGFGGPVFNVTASYTHIEGFSIKNGSVGIYLGYTSEKNSIVNNTIHNNSGGIYLSYSSGNIIYRNIIEKNAIYAVYLFNSSNNLFFDNVINGTFYLSQLKNYWNISKTAFKNIISGNYTGGNVWLNPSGTGYSQTCADSDGDGICDSAYTIAINNTDYLPLKYTGLPPTKPPTPPTPPPTSLAKIFIEPNKTAVAPGELFAVDISVQDGTANAVLVNFTFDTSKISYVTGSTQGLFNTMDTISSAADYVRYIGASTSPVNIASKTKVATAVFQVDSGASGTITFNVVTASINGASATPIVQNIKIITEPWQRYDSNGNGKIEDQELIAAILG